MSTTIKTITDEQTGQAFEVVAEHWYDILAAWISAVYSIAVIIYLAWLVVDTWSGQLRMWPTAVVNKLTTPEAANAFKLVLYTAVGGGMGAAINNMRSFVSWHAERQAFGWRFVWKYIALPPLGATLAVLVYGIIQSGMAVFNGGASVNSSAITLFSAWATGTLAGYGSHKVFIWLDDKVNSLFKVETKKVSVPDVIGKSFEEAKRILNDGQLKIGDVTKAETSDLQMIGKVIGQTPSAGTEILCESKVDLVIGSGPGSPSDHQTDSAGTTEEQVAHNGNLAASDVSNFGSDNGLEAAELEETSETLETEQTVE